ncbi:MAG TPA: DNA translocase FtsK 4TM domain-containing protein, partial [Desulfatirhabdiaceae bacterium]|nr:DNA translocase FtsK 4TM domain-containing protein [Desulfatirhabdiaceae bacterium]
MRKELFVIFSVFVIVCISISLLSFRVDDPSLFHPVRSGPVYNLFGLTGAHISGFLYGLFGKGVFWIPITLILITLQFFREKSPLVFGQILLGGVILVLTTSSVMTIVDNAVPSGNPYATPGGLTGV